MCGAQVHPQANNGSMCCPCNVLQKKELSKDDFPMPSFGCLISTILRDELVGGRGFALLRGLPVQRWSRLQTIVAYHGIGLHMGRARSQNKKAHMVGHVKVCVTVSGGLCLHTQVGHVNVGGVPAFAYGSEC